MDNIQDDENRVLSIALSKDYLQEIILLRPDFDGG
jgi:hypothetical protein